jgi:SsrA-binding protein
VAETKPKKKADGKAAPSEVPIVKNRRASFDYEIEDTYEGGLVLVGSEVKSMRAGRVDIVDAFASVDHGEVWLKQLNVQPLPQAVAFPHEPRRPRKVLLHAREIERIEKALSREGMTLVPIRLYFKDGRAKVELGLAKGKKTFDKRADMAKRTAEREARAAIGRGRKGE